MPTQHCGPRWGRGPRRKQLFVAVVLLAAFTATVVRVGDQRCAEQDCTDEVDLTDDIQLDGAASSSFIGVDAVPFENDPMTEDPQAGSMGSSNVVGAEDDAVPFENPLSAVTANEARANDVRTTHAREAPDEARRQPINQEPDGVHERASTRPQPGATER